MTNGRRNSERRRRVLYSTHQADPSSSTAATRREAERLREARRPTAAYGMRVQRRLQGRWFSLVPVRRTTLVSISLGLVGFSLLLCLLHYTAVAWPSIAYRPEIARPLRLDRPDSFGRWYSCLLLTGSAGAALLIYQLRRYRIDDYQGRYRLWRLILIVMLLASVNALVSLIPWWGAVLDAGFGKRVALAGGDWIRLLVTIAGIMVALRLGAEMRRSRWALVTLLIACSLLAIPEAAKWNFIAVESVAAWTLVTSAPLLAFTALFISLGGYLRLLYREVQEIEDGESLVTRIGQVRLRLFRQEHDGKEEQDGSAADPERSSKARHRDSEQDEDEADTSVATSRSWLPWRRGRSSEHGERKRPRSELAEKRTVASDASSKAKPRRRWLGLRRAAEADGDTPNRTKKAATDSAGESSSRPAAAKKKRRRFSLRLDPAARDDKDADSKDDAPKPDRDQERAKEPAAKKKRQKSGQRGLRRWWYGSGGSPSSEPATPKTQKKTPPPPETKSDDDINPDEIDWNAMSKSERRRLRKKLRRQGKAA